MSNWDREEFEDLVARGLIAMFETKIMDGGRRCAREHRVREDDITRIRRFGPYFPPHNSTVGCENKDTLQERFMVSLSGEMPREAGVAYEYSHPGLGWNEYLTLIYVRRIREFPGSIIPHIRAGKCYEVVLIKYESQGATAIKMYASEKDGVVFNTSRKFVDYEGFSPRVRIIDFGAKTEEDLARGEMGSPAAYLAPALQWYGEAIEVPSLWLVSANEVKARATFGVSEEEIKSLFYARQLPLTDTGRKRPILHWVAAHQRRMRNGIDVPVKEHLRGITEFAMDDTRFRIWKPEKIKAVVA